MSYLANCQKPGLGQSLFMTAVAVMGVLPLTAFLGFTTLSKLVHAYYQIINFHL